LVFDVYFDTGKGVGHKPNNRVEALHAATRFWVCVLARLAADVFDFDINQTQKSKWERQALPFTFLGFKSDFKI
jgi:hypothetical protein